MGTELLFRKLPRPFIQNRERKARAAGVPACAPGNRGSPGIIPESFGAPRFSIAEHHHPKRPGAPDRFPGNATRSCRVRLASLLYDPYVDLPESERAELTAYYRGRQLENGIAINGGFRSQVASLRHATPMQALGAYGFLGLVKGHKHFLKHVAAAMQSVQRVVAEIDGLTELDRTLGQLT